MHIFYYMNKDGNVVWYVNTINMSDGYTGMKIITKNKYNDGKWHHVSASYGMYGSDYDVFLIMDYGGEYVYEQG